MFPRTLLANAEIRWTKALRFNYSPTERKQQRAGVQVVCARQRGRLLCHMFKCLMGLDLRGCDSPEPLNVCDMLLFPYRTPQYDFCKSKFPVPHLFCRVSLKRLRCVISC